MREILHAWQDVLHSCGRLEILHAWRESVKQCPGVRFMLNA